MPADKRTLHTPHDTARMIVAVKAMTLPVVVTIRDGQDKKGEQNGLVHMWFSDVANWTGDQTAAEVKAHCNLVYGRPIMDRDDPVWASAFGYIFDALSYEAKLKAIRVLDVPFTRRMGLKQISEYMEQMSRDYREAGVPLTDPAMQKYGSGP